MADTAALDLEALLRWRSPDARHCERRYFADVMAGHDRLPGDLGERLARLAAGESLVASLPVGEGRAPYSDSLRQTMDRNRFRSVLVGGVPLQPRQGRFYPRLTLENLPGGNERQPWRCLALSQEQLEVDLNPPLAGVELELEIRLLDRRIAQEAPSIPPRDILPLLLEDGPGMQAALPGVATDFGLHEPLPRDDEHDDARFYGTARLVSHLDRGALTQLPRLYAPLLRPGTAVLDLMASWDSHLPEDVAGLQVTGLGMNAEELRHNGRLAERRVHDLNRDPRLPFPDASFDAALCSLSLEYLTRPLTVLREVQRVLKPGAPLALGFSERWFPSKAIRVWRELHAFERMGLILDLLRRTGGWHNCATESLRGLPRPRDDKYIALTPWSDPLYVVSALCGAPATGPE